MFYKTDQQYGGGRKNPHLSSTTSAKPDDCRAQDIIAK